MQYVVLITSVLILLLGGLITYKFFKEDNRMSSSVASFTLLLLILDLSLLRIGLIFDVFDWGIFQYSVKSSTFYIIAGYLNPSLLVVHFYYLVKPSGLTKNILFTLLTILITLFIAVFFDLPVFGLKKVELILVFMFLFLVIINLQVFLRVKILDVQYKIWIITVSCIEIISILMAFWQIEDVTISGNYSTLISNQMNLIIMNILILLAFFLVLQFPRILSGDIGFVENYTRIDEMEETILSSTSFASLNPQLWRFVDGSFAYHKFTNEKNLINELKKHSSEIYKKISFYQYSVILQLEEHTVIEDLFTLSQKLKVSSAVLELFFKVYCNYSWSKYVKVLRVLMAEYLISNDFLLKNDMNALAVEVGFNNRVTLYNNFKDLLGHSPTSAKQLADR